MDRELVKKEKDAAFMLQHELTREQLVKLIEGKFARARQYHDALKNRERHAEHAE